MGRAEEQAWPGQAVVGVLLEAMGLLGKAGLGGKEAGSSWDTTRKLQSTFSLSMMPFDL